MNTEAVIAVRAICQRPQIHRHGMEETVKEPAAGAVRLTGKPDACAARLMSGQFVARLRCDRARSRRHHPRSGRHHTRRSGNSARCHGHTRRSTGNSARCHRHARRATRNAAGCHHWHASRSTWNSARCHRHASRATRNAARSHHRHASGPTGDSAGSHRHASRATRNAASRIDTGITRSDWDTAVGCRNAGIGRVATGNSPTSRRRGWRRGRILRGGRVPVRERSVLVHFRLQHHPARG